MQVKKHMQVGGARKLAACAVAVALAQAVSLVPVRADIVLFDAATVSEKGVRAHVIYANRRVWTCHTFQVKGGQST